MGHPSKRGVLQAFSVQVNSATCAEASSLFHAISLCRESSDNSAVCITENDLFRSHSDSDIQHSSSCSKLS